ncbi:hypothetical protein ACFXAW_06950 [Streptomyces sp. NPDC059445]|uniref:hypothetical protein n=1 Tax=Streptomyces sp. NPDC059445 TaxID=3346832 RepID=UPI0036A3F3B1
MAKVYRKSELNEIQQEHCPKCGRACLRRLRDVTGPMDLEYSYSVTWRCPDRTCTMRPE